MKLKKWLLLSVFSVVAISPVLFITSCKKNDFQTLHDVYTETFNYPNNTQSYSLYQTNELSEKMSNLISTKLFRVVSQGEPKIDFVNNKVIVPSKMFYRLEQASKIEINWIDETDTPQTSVFDSDSIKDVSFDKLPSGDPVDSETYLAPQDENIGYKHLYQFIGSDNPRSINNPIFFQALKHATELKIYADRNDNNWIDNNGKKTPYKVSLKDFKLGFLRSLLRSPETRQKVFKGNKQLLDYDKKMSNGVDFFNSDSLIDYLKANNVNTDKFLEVHFVNLSGPLTFKLKTDGSFLESDWRDLFRNLFIFGSYTDAIPSHLYTVNLDSKDSKNYKFLYEYGKTNSDLMYSSYYYINKESLDGITFYRNKNYKNNTNWQNQYHFNEINFKFNVLPLNPQTFNIQTFSAFNQDLVSRLNFNVLDELQKQEIMDNFGNYNIQYFKHFQMYKNQIPLSINFFAHSDKLYFNDTFSKLFYGLNKDELASDYMLSKTVTPTTLEFRSLLNNVINPYVISQVHNADISLSQAPIGALINANDVGKSNYVNLLDANQQLSKQIILDDKLQKINSTTSYENKLKAQQLDNKNNYSKSLKSVDFEIIQNQIKPLLDSYFTENNTEKSVKWTIPIDNRKGLYSIKKISNFIKDIFNELDSRLQPEIYFVNNDDEYKKYFKQNSSIYSENNFEITTPDTNGFLYKYLTLNNYQILAYLIYIAKVSNSTDAYKEIKRFIHGLEINFGFTRYEYKNDIFRQLKYSDLNDMDAFFKKHDLSKAEFNQLLQQFLLSYSKRNISYTILNLINEIANVTSYTISFDNNIYLNNYSKNILQKYIIKPASYYNLDYLQDITVNAEAAYEKTN